MTLSMTLGEQLKKLRAEKALSQPELAELAGIEQSYLSKLENDKSLPSSEVLGKLLRAFSLSVAQLLESLDENYIKNNLLVINDIEKLYQQASTKQLNRQRNFLYIASTFIVLAVTLFYIGYTKQVFNETLYEYRSDGVVLAGEPSDIFWKWRELIDIKDRNEKDEKTRQLKIVMAQRSDVLVKLIPQNKGYYFEEAVAGGRRLFTKAKHDLPIKQPRAINAWLQVIGVMLLISGIMGFVLERRLFNLSK
ncbi:helix-turn-helix domain-containing protein [Colwellia psychrerythraea]|uniref:Transcriptional regulator, XRE family n=1 Tax=Colwellia psychrerythraea TaxID=28229 RepID=A0A099L342_COLPS|nr:helix-turn-helix transcriptional regulator [Colwellia psychrerythraea]KGJ97384.1 transcriptional regulator, XRE family [Colwellia psychrerythraea]